MSASIYMCHMEVSHILKCRTNYMLLFLYVEAEPLASFWLHKTGCYSKILYVLLCSNEVHCQCTSFRMLLHEPKCVLEFTSWEQNVLEKGKLFQLCIRNG